MTREKTILPQAGRQAVLGRLRKVLCGPVDRVWPLSTPLSIPYTPPINPTIHTLYTPYQPHYPYPIHPLATPDPSRSHLDPISRPYLQTLSAYLLPIICLSYIAFFQLFPIDFLLIASLLSVFSSYSVGPPAGQGWPLGLTRPYKAYPRPKFQLVPANRRGGSSMDVTAGQAENKEEI